MAGLQFDKLAKKTKFIKPLYNTIYEILLFDFV